MFYINSETILNNAPYLSLYRGELSAETNTIIYQLPIEHITLVTNNCKFCIMYYILISIFFTFICIYEI